MRVWTYSDDAQLVLQLAQLSQIITNFRSFTVKVCLPLDVVFLVDLTGSMYSYVGDVANPGPIKEEMKELMWVLNTMNKCPVRYSVVGFKDFTWETTMNPSGLTENYDEINAFIDDMIATMGAGWPQSHYLGFEAARDLFNAADPSSFPNDKIVVFITDAESGFDDARDFTHAAPAARELAEMGVKIHPVLCFQDPELMGTPDPIAEEQCHWYAAISNGNMVYAPLPACRFVPGVTSNPTWIVKLTPITPFDSFRLKLNSSTPTQKEGFYTFHIWVDFFCKAVPWHEFFVTELMANLEKAEIPPYVPEPPGIPVPPPPITVSLTTDPFEQNLGADIDFIWEIISPPEVTPINVMLRLTDPDGVTYGYDQGTTLAGTLTWTAIEPTGWWMATVTYQYQYGANTYATGAFADFQVIA